MRYCKLGHMTTTKLSQKIAIVTGVYIAFQMLSDIMSLRILYLFGMSVDGGTLIYPLTFTVRDLLHRLGGKHVTHVVVILAAIINLFMVFAFWLVSVLPPDLTVGVQETFGQVLVPFWRIVVASILAEVFAQLVDGEIYERWVNRFGTKRVLGRVLVSNGFSIPIDTLIFTTVAFWGVMPISVVGSIFVANILLKFVLATISIPVIYGTKA